uniref:Uncharacterized protein n=1 Tax=Chelativorans sp. (strain BNC1) TaxID=266779 RepID=Q11DJ5_CHESB
MCFAARVSLLPATDLPKTGSCPAYRAISVQFIFPSTSTRLRTIASRYSAVRPLGRTKNAVNYRLRIGIRRTDSDVTPMR